VDHEQLQRKKFITDLGGSVAVAKALGKSGHTNISNQIRNGFFERYKAGLIALANDKGVTDVPEEVLTSKQLYQRLGLTPLNTFIKALVRTYGGWQEFHEASGIPIASLKSMSKRSVRVMPSHVPALEKAATDMGVPLPENWDEAREAYRRLEEKKQASAKRKSATDENLA
jgi:hypothetical protein